MPHCIYWTDATILLPGFDNNGGTLVRLPIGLRELSRDEADEIITKNEVIGVAAKSGDFRRSTC